MQYLSLYAFDHVSGETLPGASVSVFTTATSPALASLFDASGTSIDNPLISGNSGLVGFAAADGDYNVIVTPAGGAAQPAIKIYLLDPADIADSVAAAQAAATSAEDAAAAAQSTANGAASAAAANGAATASISDQIVSINASVASQLASINSLFANFSDTAAAAESASAALAAETASQTAQGLAQTANTNAQAASSAASAAVSLATTEASNGAAAAATAATAATNASTANTAAQTANSAAQGAAAAAATQATNSANSASASAGSASSSMASMNAAAGSATASAASATAAQTAQGQASTSAGQAATSATNASGSASQAATYSSTAASAASAATATTATLLPSTLDATGTYFSLNYNSTGAAPAGLGPTNIISVSGVGYVYQTAASQDVTTLGHFAAGASSTYQFSSTMRNSVAGSAEAYIGLGCAFYDNTDAYIGYYLASYTAMPTVGSWYTGTVSLATSAVLAGATYNSGKTSANVAYLRPFANVGVSANCGTVQMSSLGVVDVTQSTAAGASASAAATSATNAAASNSAAASFASSAATSATTATTQAGNANTYAGQASTSASNAQGYANTATTQAGVSTTQAGNSAGSASAAANSASTAATQSTAASNSASSASASANTATTQAGNASTSAGQSATSATNAASSANSASTYSSNSANSASASAGSATSASGSASTATTQATNAANSATSAQGYATTAASQAANSANNASAASTSASGAATSASNAATASSAASAASVSATATAANLFPSTFALGGTYFTTAYSTFANPGSITAAGGISFPTVSGYGTVLQNAGVANYNVCPIGCVNLISSHTYNITGNVQCTTDVTSGSAGYVNLLWSLFSASGSYLGYLNFATANLTVSSGVLSFGAGINTTTAQLVVAQAGAAYARPILQVSAGTGGVYQLLSLTTSDVTNSVAAANSASAAATSASTAAASQSSAAASASSASTSATNASTSAGQATTSAGQASSSATSATGSATSAGTYATNSANSASAAATSASGAATKASNASASASTASTAATNAGNSATSATSSANTATTQAGNSATSASAASSAAAAASTSAAAAQTSATLSASVGANAQNKNASFATYSNATGVPDLWSDWGYGFAFTRQAGQVSTYAADVDMGSISGVTAGTNVGLNQTVYMTAGYSVLEASVWLESGALAGSGMGVYGSYGYGLSFALDPDTNGVVNGGSAGPRVYTFSKLIQYGATEAATLYLFTNYPSIDGSSGSIKQMRWYRAAVRPAGPGDMTGPIALTNVTSLTATVASNQSAQASINGAQASTNSSVSASLNGLNASVSSNASAVTTLQGQYASLTSTVTSQGATSSTQQTAISTLQGQVAIYLTQVSTSGSTALVELAATSGGASEILLQANNLFVGPNAQFDETTNTWQYVAGSFQRRDGADFGANSDLILWFGPLATAVSTMTKYNGSFALANDGMIYLGAATLQNPGGTKSNIGSAASIGSASMTTFARASFANIIAGAYWSTFNAMIQNTSIGSNPFNTGSSGTIDWQICEVAAGKNYTGASGQQVLASGSFTGAYVSGEGVGFPNATSINNVFAFGTSPGKACSGTGARDVILQFQLASPSSMTGQIGSVSATWGPGG